MPAMLLSLVVDRKRRSSIETERERDSEKVVCIKFEALSKLFKTLGNFLDMNPLKADAQVLSIELS